MPVESPISNSRLSNHTIMHCNHGVPILRYYPLAVSIKASKVRGKRYVIVKDGRAAMHTYIIAYLGG
jgi:hypothetical protein